MKWLITFLKKYREYTVGSFFKLKVVPCCLFLVLDGCVVHNYKVFIYTCSIDTIDLFKSPWCFWRLHVSRRTLSNIRILEIGKRQQCQNQLPVDVYLSRVRVAQCQQCQSRVTSLAKGSSLLSLLSFLMNADAIFDDIPTCNLRTRESGICITSTSIRKFQVS